MNSIASLLEYIEDNGIHLTVEDSEIRCVARHGSFTNELRDEIISNKDKIISYIKKYKAQYPLSLGEHRKAEQLRAREIIPIINQNRVWRSSRPGSKPDRDLSRFHFALKVVGADLISQIDKIVAKIVDENKILTSRVVEWNGSPAILSDFNYRFEMKFVNLSTLPMNSRESEATSAAENWAWNLFDLESDPPFRCFQIKLSSEEVVFGFTFHHIICDPYTVPAFRRRLIYLVKNYVSGDAEESVSSKPQYTDHLLELNRWLESPEFYAAFFYWKRKLENAPRSTDFFEDDVQNGRDQSISTSPFFINEGNVVKLKKESAALKVTMFVTLMALHLVALSYSCGKHDLIINMPYSSREDEVATNLIGAVANHYYFRIQLSEEMKIDELIRAVRRTFLDTISNGRMPFEVVVERICNGYLRVPIFNYFPLLPNVDQLDEYNSSRIIEVPIEAVHTQSFWPPEIAYGMVLAEGRENIEGMIRYFGGANECKKVEKFIKNFQLLIENLDALIVQCNDIKSCHAMMI